MNWVRKNYFIKKDLQGRHIFNFFIFVIAGSIIFTIIFSLLSSDTFSIVYDNYNLRIGKTPLILFKEILRTHWIFVVLSGIVIILFSVFITHQYAGPIYRFEKSFIEMMEGNHSNKIVLRKRDEHKELAELINRFNSTISSNIKEMGRLSEEVDGSLLKASESVKYIEGAEVAILDLDKAISSNKKIKDMLCNFKVEND